jgi:UDP-glucuronate 4-epimerase
MGAQNVLVTGAAGFIGSHLVERLLTRGDVVIGADNFDPFYSPADKRHNLRAALEHPGFTLVQVDCARPRSLHRALAAHRVDAVVHLAARAGVRPSILDPLGYTRANIVATQVLLEWARRREVRRFVFGSSSSVYGNPERVPFREDDAADRPISPYAATKRAGELLCHTYHHLHGVHGLALRFFTVYGPRQRPDLAIRKFATAMLRGEPIRLFGDGSSARDYTWVDDIVDGVVAALDRTRSMPGEFEIINLGSNHAVRLDHLIQLIAGAAGVEPRIRQAPAQPGDVQRTFADLDKAARLLGYSPRMTVERGIPRFIDWLRAHQAIPAG